MSCKELLFICKYQVKGELLYERPFFWMNSLFQHGVEPFRWLLDVLNRIAECKMSQLDVLLPQNWVDSSLVK